MTQYLPWCPCCRTAECEYSFAINSTHFMSFKETNWPEETPVFDTEWDFNNSRVQLKNRGAFTLVYDTQDPMSHYSSAMFEASFLTDSLTVGSECGVTLLMPWEDESISLWWLGGNDYELRQGTTVLEAFTTTVPPTSPYPSWTIIRIVLVNATATTSDVECWVQGQLVHTETNVAWSKPELLDYGACVNGEVYLRYARAAPCGLQCIIEHECGVDTEAPEIWTLTCPPIVNKANPDPVGNRYLHCQDAVSGFFPGGHTLVRQYQGKTQGLIEVDHMSTSWPRQFEWQDCFDGESVNQTPACAWIAVVTESQSLGVAPYLCYSPVRSGITSGPWVCNMEVVNSRDTTKYAIRSKGFCPAVYDEDENAFIPTDDWFGPTAIGDCTPERPNPLELPNDGDYYPNSETWRIFIRYFDEVPEWQSDQETIPFEGYQVIAVANFSLAVSYPAPDYQNFNEVVAYYSDWYTVSQPVPSTSQITLVREDIRYPIHVGSPWEIWYEFPDEIYVTPNGVGNNDSYTRYCRGLTCQPILDPEEDIDYTFTMTYELPDESLLVDEPTVRAYFHEEDDSWEWYGFGQPISLIDCPEFGQFYYHIHCIKEANGGRGQWVLDITNPDNVMSRLLMIVDEELGITFEGTVISGCDGQLWDGIMDNMQLSPVHIDRRFGACRAGTIGGTFGITCDLGGSAGSSFQLRTNNVWTMPPMPDNYVLHGTFKLGSKWFAIAVWAINSTTFEVEIREGMLVVDPLSAIGTNWTSLPYVWNYQDEYVCHPGTTAPMLPAINERFDYFMVDTFGVCPNTGGFSGGDISISW